MNDLEYLAAMFTLIIIMFVSVMQDDATKQLNVRVSELEKRISKIDEDGE